MQIHIYIPDSKVLRWIFKKISQLWCTQTFPQILGIFAIFHHNFVKIMAPPSDENQNYVVHLRGQSLLINVENSIKINP